MDGGMSWKSRIAFDGMKDIDAEVIRLVRIGQIRRSRLRCAIILLQA